MSSCSLAASTISQQGNRQLFTPSSTSSNAYVYGTYGGKLCASSPVSGHTYLVGARITVPLNMNFFFNARSVNGGKSIFGGYNMVLANTSISSKTVLLEYIAKSSESMGICPYFSYMANSTYTLGTLEISQPGT
jgi:hypothetical protein